MGSVFAFFVVIILTLIAFIGVKAANLHVLFGILIPYAAFVTFLVGIIYRVLFWWGTFACTIPYTDNLRSEEVIALDQAEQA